MADYYVGNIFASSDYLEHYGVLGMKWGIRKNPDSYRYVSHTTKKYNRKADKAEARGQRDKAEIYRNRAKRSAELDSREEEYARNASLLTSITNKSYVQALATMNAQNQKGITKEKVRAYIGASLGGMAYGAIRKAKYIRQDDPKMVKLTPKYMKKNNLTFGQPYMKDGRLHADIYQR